MAAQCLENVQRGHVAEPQPNDLRGRPVQKRELPEIRVLRHDDKPLVRRVLPDLDIGRRVETNAGDVLATRELDSELTNKVSGQVLVEQQPHAGVASRRSRIAANSIAARTWSAVNSGQLGKICDDLIDGHARCQIIQDVINCYPRPNKTWLAASHPRTGLDHRRQLHDRQATRRCNLPSRSAPLDPGSSTTPTTKPKHNLTPIMQQSARDCCMIW
jgi:hypothetical protein